MIKFSIEGVPHLTAALKDISTKVRDKYLKAGVTKAARLVRKAVKRNLQKKNRAAAAKLNHQFADKSQLNEIVGRTGLLEKSIDIKIINYRNGNIIGLVGPDNKMSMVVGKHTKDKTITRRVYKAVRSKTGQIIERIDTGEVNTYTRKAGEDIIHRPSKIAHLVEFGHGGPAPAPPHPFMRPAWESTKGAALAAIKDTLEAGLAMELSK